MHQKLSLVAYQGIKSTCWIFHLDLYFTPNNLVKIVQ